MVRVKQQKLTEEEFLKERKEVLSQWPTGKDVDLEEAADYLSSLSESRNFEKVVDKLRRRGQTVSFPRGGTPLPEDQTKLNNRMLRAGVPLIPITTDSYTRLGQFQTVKNVLDSTKTGRPKLNGYPLVNHGIFTTRKVLEQTEAAYCARFNGADNRLLAEIAIASGMTSALLDPFEVFGSYTKNATVEECIRNYQYTFRLGGFYAERGISVTADLIGWLPNGVFPFTNGLVSEIVATLLAAEQGLKSVTPNVQVQGNLVQDVAWIRATKSLMREYLDRFGFYDFAVPGVFAANVPIFPCPQEQHTTMAYMLYSAMVACLGGAQAAVLRTVDEAVGIPTEEAHGITYEAGQWIYTVMGQQKFQIDDKEIDKEQEITEGETRAIMEKILLLGEGDVAVGYARAVQAGIVDAPMSPNVHTKGEVLGVRDARGAVRYLDFGNLPIPDEIKEFHRERVNERSIIERRPMDYQVSIQDFWAISKGSLLGLGK
jgi:methylaspartate mutase epsilon subunit